MSEAIKQAEKAVIAGEIPVGAILVDPKKNEIIAKAHNNTKISSNPLGHAEINVIMTASKKLKLSRLDGYDLYCTLEPCAMCAAAISTARIRRLYFALEEPKFGAIVNNFQFFTTKACHHKVEYYYGFEEKKIEMLLRNFFQEKRGKK